MARFTLDREAHRTKSTSGIHPSHAWDAPELVEQSRAARWLLRGEAAALDHCFPEGLTGRHVLELGCGAGRITAELVARGARVVGLDPSEPMVAAAQEAIPDAAFVRGDAAELEFSDASFELVFFGLGGIDCIAPKERRLDALREAHRVLSSGGYLIYSSHSAPALALGWYRSLHPSKWRMRMRRLLRGAAFQSEVYLTAEAPPGRIMYHGRPSRMIRDTVAQGFALDAVFANDPVLAFVAGRLGVSAPVKWADPWPYFAFRRCDA